MRFFSAPHLASFLVLACAAALLCVSCGGGAVTLDPSYVAVHNTMTAMGLAMSGEIYEGSLSEGEVERIPRDLRAGDCYTLVVFGGDGVSNVDLVVRDGTGVEVATDRTSDSQAAAQLCPESDGQYEVVVTMTHGGGAFVLTSWSGSPHGGGIASGGGSSRGTCAAPLPLTLNQPVTGSTAQASHNMTGRCIPGSEAPETIYLLRLERRAQVSVSLNSDFDGALYILGTCNNPSSEIACNDDMPDTTRSQVDATLDPGEYYVVVDGYSGGSGNYELLVAVQELQNIAQICRSATALTPGQAITASTAGRPGYFTATCAGGARSPDRVYTLDVAARSRLRLRMQSTHDGAIYVRSSCQDPNTEIACNDDHQDTSHSMLVATLDPGRYFVYADGFASNSQGDYSLRADLVPLSGGSAAADSCAAPGTVTANRDIDVDTFPATDDYAGTCGGQGAPDVVYTLNVTRRTRLRANLAQSEFPAAMYIRRTCDQSSTEVQCASGGAGSGQTALDTNLQPGTYYLIVDGVRANQFGSARVEIQMEDLQALEAACQSAPRIRPGRTIQGDTSSSQNRFQATCASNAQSNDVVYRLVLTRRSQVVVTSEQQFDGAIYIRSDCTSLSTEVACNDDHPPGDNRHSRIEATLDPGTYFVFVDGFGASNQGSFTMDVAVTRAAGP